MAVMSALHGLGSWLAAAEGYRWHLPHRCCSREAGRAAGPASKGPQ